MTTRAEINGGIAKLATENEATRQPIGTGPIQPRPLEGRALALARAAWLAIALLTVGVLLAGIPLEYQRLQTPANCARYGCVYPRLTPDSARQLAERGLTPRAFAAYFTAVEVLFAAGWLVVAGLIFARRSSDRTALLVALTLVTYGTTFANFSVLQIYPWLALTTTAISFLGEASFGLFPLIFPDGRFVFGWTLWLAAAYAVYLALFYFLPGLPADALWLFELKRQLFWLMLGAGLFVQVYRYTRVSNLEQRRQTKWVVFGIALAFGGLAALSLLGSAFQAALLRDPLLGILRDTAVYAALLLIPLSIGAAILRSRLWDIDLLINRTLAYTALTACVVGIYTLIVGGLGILFQAGNSPLAALLATGLVAVLFQPLRERLQRAVNRLLYGERDDPYASLARLGQRLAATLAPDTVLPTIVETVAQALRLPYVAIALRSDARPDNAPEVVASYGTPASHTLCLPLVYQQEPIGELLLAPRAPGESFGAADLRLLNDLAHQAGMAAHTVRLTAELRRARERLISAREEERRRLRRDLHDGLGPQLASQALTLDAARKLLRQDIGVADEMLSDAVVHAQDAIADIRRLVYNLRPPTLDDLGLVAALREQAAHYVTSGVRITVAAPDRLPPLPAAAEVACYRIAQEALTNVVRHARAHSCAVTLTVDRALLLEVRDDGQGLPEGCRAGVGLTAMRERAEELGGSCAVERLSGGGTRVRARLPLEPAPWDI